MPILEIRTYRLQPGTRDEYDRLFREEALPLLARFGIDVVGAGPSIDDQHGYFLIRAFQDLGDRQRREDLFYASPEWRLGPREAIIEKIEVFTDAVIEVDEKAIDGLRSSVRNSAAASSGDQRTPTSRRSAFRRDQSPGALPGLRPPSRGTRHARP